MVEALLAQIAQIVGRVRENMKYHTNTCSNCIKKTVVNERATHVWKCQREDAPVWTDLRSVRRWAHCTAAAAADLKTNEKRKKIREAQKRSSAGRVARTVGMGYINQNLGDPERGSLQRSQRT